MHIFRLAWNRFLLGFLLCAAFLSFACRICADGKITVTKEDSFSDSNNKGKVEVGETIEYTITIENIGNEDASNINLEDILGPNLTLVPNSVVVAKDDLYSCVGNTDLDVDSENGILSNDLDPDNTALAVTLLNGDTDLSGPTTYGGSVQMTEDGSFVYIPPGPGGDIDFDGVEIAGRNEIGVLIKDAQGKVDYSHTSIPNPKGAGGYGIRLEDSSEDITFAGTVGFGSISNMKMTGKIRNNDLD
ncbi:MAG: hypothetical protein ACMUIU_03490 [bacterium]